MHYHRACIDAIGYRLAPEVVASEELEERLGPLYRALGLTIGTLEAMTGIVERRYWAPGTRLRDAAADAVLDALERANVPPAGIDALVYAGVNREHVEPAMACHVAGELHARGHALRPDAVLFDVSNACLGVMTGIAALACRIELGQIRRGIVVATERARHIVDNAITRLNREPTLDTFRLSYATLTGGAGAVAVMVAGVEDAVRPHRLLAAVERNDARQHELCVWGTQPARARGGALDLGGAGSTPPAGALPLLEEFMRTDAVAVLEHGLALGAATWRDLNAHFADPAGRTIARTVCHQVGSKHREKILGALGLRPANDFVAYSHLGNTGSVALPLAAALADEREFLRPGDYVGFLGIGSGLNCAMFSLEW